MPLGLLARDSIADLGSIGRDPDERSSPTVSNGGKNADSAIARKQNSAISGSSIATNGSVLASQIGGGRHGALLVSSFDERRQQQQLQAKEANPQQPPSFQPPSFHYAGYTEDYYHDDYSLYADGDHYAVPNLLLPKTKELGGIWCCLFPWLEHKHPPKIHATLEQDRNTLGDNLASRNSASVDNNGDGQRSRDFNPSLADGIKDEDASGEGESTNSNILGERLSDRERQAVLARLRLAQPETIMQHPSNSNGVGNETYVEQEESLKHQHASEKSNRPTKGLLNGIPVYDKSPLEELDSKNPTKLKGILKTRSAPKIDESMLESGNKGGQSTGLVSSNDSSSASLVGPQHIRKPRRSLFPSYEDRKPRTAAHNVSFAPMARVVTVKSKNDMAEDEKSDIWWQRSDYEAFRKAGRIITRAMLEGGSEIWLASNESLLGKKDKKGASSSTGDIIQAAGDKWWHKFGHSRRGLEHVVSVDEGRQRQMNVKNAIRAVVEEQSRQKMCKREDPEKLRTVALHHTSWARDLALASAASDAHAVESSFSEGRHSREFYLLKMARSKPNSNSSSAVNVPQFMKPAIDNIAPKTPIVQQRLDAFTSSQIQFRRRKNGATSGDATTEVESTEQVHDAQSTEKGKESLAHQAAGFSADGKKVNMAAVLSGMGAVRVQTKDEKLPVMRVAS
jgi:hypothetical protein